MKSKKTQRIIIAGLVILMTLNLAAIPTKNLISAPECEINVRTIPPDPIAGEESYIIVEDAMEQTCISLYPSVFLVQISEMSPVFISFGNDIAHIRNRCDRLTTRLIKYSGREGFSSNGISEHYSFAFPGTYYFLLTVLWFSPDNQLKYNNEEYMNSNEAYQNEIYNYGAIPFPSELIVTQKLFTVNVSGDSLLRKLSFSETSITKDQKTDNLKDAINIFQEGCEQNGYDYIYNLQQDSYEAPDLSIPPTSVAPTSDTAISCNPPSKPQSFWEKIKEFFFPLAKARGPGSFLEGQCTQYAADARPDAYEWLPDSNAYAKFWDDYAREAGIPVDHTPSVGDIVVWEANCPPAFNDGHVAIVEEVQLDNIVVSQMNVPMGAGYSKATYPILDSNCMSFIHQKKESVATENNDDGISKDIDEPKVTVISKIVNWISNLWRKILGE